MALIIAILSSLGVIFLLLWQMIIASKGKRQRLDGMSPVEPPQAEEIDVDEDERLSPLLTDAVGDEGYYLVLDTETVDPVEETAEEDVRISPAVSIAWQVLTREGHCLEEAHYILYRSVGLDPRAVDIHGITASKVQQEGVEPAEVYSCLLARLEACSVVVAHNLDFHLSVLRLDLARFASQGEWERGERARLLSRGLEILEGREGICLMMEGTKLGFKRRRDGSPMYPRLDELFAFLHGIPKVRLRYRLKGLRDVRLASASLRKLFLS